MARHVYACCGPRAIADDRAAPLSPAAGAAVERSPAGAAGERRNRKRPGHHALPASSKARPSARRPCRGKRSRAVSPARSTRCGTACIPATRAADRGRTGCGGQAGRHDRRVQGGALAAAAGRLPGDRRRRQGVADVQGEEEHPIRDPRGGAPHLPAGGASRSTSSCRPPRSPRPGPAARAGASGQVDRIQNINAAYSIDHARRGQLPDQPRRTRPSGGCVNGALFAPGTRSFEGASARFRVNCGGYRLFTPGPGKGGRLQLRGDPEPPNARASSASTCRSTVASGMQTAPGEELGNYGRSSGRLEGGGVQVLRLYRMDVDQPLQPDAAAERAGERRIQPAAARPERRADRLLVQRQRLAEAPAAVAQGPLLRGRLGAQPHLRRLHAHARVAHDHPYEGRLRCCARQSRARRWRSRSASRRRRRAR